MQKLVDKAVSKDQFLQNDFGRYFVAAVMAGVYVGFSYFFTMVVGVAVKQAVDGMLYKVAIGATFAIALNLIVFAGAELFTGSNMLMTVGVLDKKISIFNMIKLWIVCYLGNLIGSIIMSAVLVGAGVSDNIISEFMINLTNIKVSYSIQEMFFRGVLCNIMVCLGVLFAYIMKDEVAKLIMIFWCIFAFATSGYEHSIANMSLFSISWMLDVNNTLNIENFGASFFWVTLGNIVGGAIVGIVYYYLGTNKNK